MENPLTHEIRDGFGTPRLATGPGKEHGLQKVANDFAQSPEKLYQARTANGDSPLYQRLSVLAPLLVLSIGACEASQKDVGGAKTEQKAAAERPVAADKPGKSVTNEQVPISQQFRSLDEYLAHLERMEGPVDGPWYKEIRPGIYELQTGNLRILGAEQQKQIFTREELRRKFGFTE